MNTLYNIYSKLSLSDLKELRNNSKSEEEYEFYEILINLKTKTY